MANFVNNNRKNLFYTICIFFNHFAFGISSNILWPSLVDIGYIYDTPIETISLLVTFSSIGYLLGSLVGYLYKWINRQLSLAILVTILSVTLALASHYPTVWFLFVAVVLNGLGGGSWDSSNNIWLVEMWPTMNAAVMQSSQFMYGLGTIVGPILVSPYIHGDNPNSTTNGTITTTTPSSFFLVGDEHIYTPEERKESLTTPFTIAAFIQFVVPVLFFVSFFVSRYKKTEEPKVTDDTTSIQSSSPTPYMNQQPEQMLTTAEAEMELIPNRTIKLVFIALFLATYDAAEIGYFFFAPTAFQKMDIRLTATESAHVASVLSAAYTCGRLLTAFISLKLKPDFIICYHYVIITLAQLVLFFGRDKMSLIYTGTALLGYGFSAMWPAILAFTERHIRLSDRTGSVMFFSAGFVSVFSPLIIGGYLETKPLIMFLFEFVYLLISLVLFLFIKLILLRR